MAGRCYSGSCRNLFRAHRNDLPIAAICDCSDVVGPHQQSVADLGRIGGLVVDARDASADLQQALDAWNRGYCPACGSWPALAEVADGHRTLRCSFCSSAWELTTYACIYCGEGGETFATTAPDTDRHDRRLELCSTCGGYLKTIDLPALSPFPLLSISDIETTDLDVIAMEHGFRRPQLKEVGKVR